MNHIKIPTFALAIVSVAVAVARVTSIGRLPSSGYFDTETSTNIAFNVSRDDVRDFKVTLDCIGTASNCVEVAFGRDADENGRLDSDECDMMFGWRRGSYFVEESETENRIEESAAATNTAMRLSLCVKTNPDIAPRMAVLGNGTELLFPDFPLSAAYKRGWNMLRVTRRGINAAYEACEVETKYGEFAIHVR